MDRRAAAGERATVNAAGVAWRNAAGFLAAVVMLASGALWGLPSGKSVAGALVILDGGVPYRDFWTMYAPGQFYTVAALYWLFGRELLVPAVFAAVAIATAACLYFRLLIRVGATRWAAWSLCAVFVLMFWTTAPELTDYQLVLPFLLLSLDRTVRYYGDAGPRNLYWAGAWLGIAAWFKHDVAAYVAAGTAISLIVAWVGLGARRPHTWIRPARATTSMAAAALIAAMPAAVWTAWTAGPEAWDALFLFPATTFADVRRNQFPPLIPDLSAVMAWLADIAHVRRALNAAEAMASWILLYAPVVIFLAGIAGVFSERRQRGLNPDRIAALILFLACMPFFWGAAHVQQNTHPYTLAILGGLIAVMAWPSRVRLGARRGTVLLAVAAGACIYVGGLLTSPAARAAAVYYEWEGSRALDLPGFSGLRVPARIYRQIRPIGEFFRTHTDEGEPIYTGLARHDAIVINNALLYAIAGRRVCCGFTELHPGVADRASVQRQIVRRLEASGVRAVALWEFGWSAEEMERRKGLAMAAVPDAGSTLLDRYIAEHFEIVESHDEYHVLWRRGAPRAP
jgi:hypothetical protein